MARIIIYHHSKHIFNNSIRRRTIEDGSPLPNGYYLTEEEAIEAYNKRKQQEYKIYIENKQKADDKLVEVEAIVNKILSENGCSFWADSETGDVLLGYIDNNRNQYHKVFNEK